MADSEKPTIGTRFLALLLTGGGIAGIGVFIWLATKSQMHASLLVFLGLFVLLFAWCSWKGVDLWRGKRSGYRWAKILFAAQIPVVTLPGFHYEFYTGLNLALMFGDGGGNLPLNLGSSISLYFSPQVVGTAYGINLIALSALVYLLLFVRRPAAAPAAA